MNLIIRDANYEDLPSIVRVHNNSFVGFFLTSLGNPFLNELYKGFVKSDTGIARVACDGTGKVVGFSAGTLDAEVFFSDLKRKRGLKFFLCAIPGIFKNPKQVTIKLYRALFYKGDSTSKLNSAALLSSIAVDPSYSGQSIGKKLLRDFEKQVLKTKQCDSVYLITDNVDNDKVISFYINSEYVRESEFFQSDNRQMLRLFKKI